jgi:hypothetical protein
MNHEMAQIGAWSLYRGDCRDVVPRTQGQQLRIVAYLQQGARHA